MNKARAARATANYKTMGTRREADAAAAAADGEDENKHNDELIELGSGPAHARRAFLAACAGDQAAARSRIEERARWRRAVPAAICARHNQCAFSKLLEGVPIGSCGVDNDGDPVVVLCGGRFNMRYAESIGVSRENMVDFSILLMLFCCESLLPLPASTARRITIVVDASGIGLQHATPSFIRVGTDIGWVHYMHFPSILKRIIVVNAGFVCRAVWKIIQPIVTDETKAVTSFVSASDSARALLAIAPPHSIPEFLGGKGRNAAIFGTTSAAAEDDAHMYNMKREIESFADRMRRAQERPPVRE